MSILPSRIQDLIDFFDMHAPVWATSATSIGLTAAQATAFQALATAAHDAYTAKLAADQASLAATVTLRAAVGDARQSASDLIRIIKAYAENSAKPDVVYNLAQIPPPATPKPAAPPAQPTEIAVSLVPTTGALELRWKAANPAGTSGTSYIVRRREPGGGSEFVFVGVTGEKRFVDDTFMSGPESVEYTVQGQRADSAGPVSEIFTIHFGKQGSGGVGLTIESVSSAGGTRGGAAKLAA